MPLAESVVVIGGGLAGAEAAWQAGIRGVPVRLYEMRPKRSTGAHRTDRLAELVCSNSFKSNLPTSASGELKREMRHLGSLILDSADKAAIPAGEALAVDREVFASAVEEGLSSLPNVTIVREELAQIPADSIVIVATGPLTSDALASEISRITGSERLYFYDAVAPIVETESIDFAHCFEASRYGRGEAAYLNCPMSQDLYEQICEAICSAETVPLHDFEAPKFFEGCLPLEEIARRGRETLAHGPWKPVGLIDPRTGQRPYAVLQLRRENADGTFYSLVACQTRMTWPEQRRIFAMIPALANATFLRLGVVHRNTYLDAPRLLDLCLRLRSQPAVFFAGQIVGVEGYLESAAMGMLAGMNAARVIHSGDPTLSESELFVPPRESMLGALVQHVSASESSPFAPMNANFGILPPSGRVKGGKDGRRAAACARAFEALCAASPPYAGSALQASLPVG